MPSGETARRKLKFLKTTDAPKVSEETEILANALDNDCETSQVKKLSELSVAKLRGRLGYVEETSEKGLYWDSGAIWVPINTAIATGQISAKAITASLMAENSITEANKALASESIVTGNIKLLAVTAAKLGAESVEESKIKALSVSKGKLTAALAAEITGGSNYQSIGATGVLKNEHQSFPSPYGIKVVTGQVLLATFMVALEPSENEALAQIFFNGTEIKFGAYSASLSGSVYQQSATRRFTGLNGTYNVTGEAWATSGQGNASASVAYQLLNA